MSDTGMTNATPFVQIRNLKMHFPVTEGVVIQRTVAQVKAVDGVSLKFQKVKHWGWSASRAAVKPLLDAASYNSRQQQREKSFSKVSTSLSYHKKSWCRPARKSK